MEPNFHPAAGSRLSAAQQIADVMSQIESLPDETFRVRLFKELIRRGMLYEPLNCRGDAADKRKKLDELRSQIDAAERAWVGASRRSLELARQGIVILEEELDRQSREGTQPALDQHLGMTAAAVQQQQAQALQELTNLLDKHIDELAVEPGAADGAMDKIQSPASVPDGGVPSVGSRPPLAPQLRPVGSGTEPNNADSVQAQFLRNVSELMSQDSKLLTKDEQTRVLNRLQNTQFSGPLEGIVGAARERLAGERPVGERQGPQTSFTAKSLLADTRDKLEAPMARTFRTLADAANRIASAPPSNKWWQFWKWGREKNDALLAGEGMANFGAALLRFIHQTIRQLEGTAAGRNVNGDTYSASERNALNVVDDFRKTLGIIEPSLSVRLRPATMTRFLAAWHSAVTETVSVIELLGERSGNLSALTASAQQVVDALSRIAEIFLRQMPSGQSWNSTCDIKRKLSLVRTKLEALSPGSSARGPSSVAEKTIETVQPTTPAFIATAQQPVAQNETGPRECQRCFNWQKADSAPWHSAVVDGQTVFYCTTCWPVVEREWRNPGRENLN